MRIEEKKLKEFILDSGLVSRADYENTENEIKKSGQNIGMGEGGHWHHLQTAKPTNSFNQRKIDRQRLFTQNPVGKNMTLL